jgi:hypothetical protein
MVAKITTGKTMLGLLQYNFSKVREGKAEFVSQQGFPETMELTVHQMANRFKKRFQMNPRTKTNVVHISLNFSQKDSLDDDKLALIAKTYLTKIGFGDQPYLVFRHEDANHPHIHIVTTNIRKSGQRIETHNIGKTLSEIARKSIEEEFCLVEAEKQGRQQSISKPLEKASYGDSETKAIITSIVTEVMKTYTFSSVAEFKAALAQFNIGMAIQNTKNKSAAPGITYFISDSSGNRKSRGVNASRIFGNPTYNTLSRKALKNTSLKKAAKENTRARIEAALKRIKEGKEWLDIFEKELKKEGVFLYRSTNAEGKVFGLTFVNNQNRTVFKASDLQKSFTMGSLRRRFEGDPQLSIVFSKKETPQERTVFSKPPFEQPTSLLNLPSLGIGSLATFLTGLYDPVYVSNDTHVIGRDSKESKQRKKKKKI